jgi:hypothetical protein
MKHRVFVCESGAKYFDANEALQESVQVLFQATQVHLKDTQVHPLFYSDHDMSTMMLLIELGPVTNCVHPFVVELDDAEDEQSIHISSGIFLYNYGLAHHLYYRTKKIETGFMCSMSIHNASRLIEMALQVIGQNSGKREVSLSHHTHLTMGVGGIILNTLAVLYSEKRELALALDTLERAAVIGSILQEAFARGLLHPTTIAAAA